MTIRAWQESSKGRWKRENGGDPCLVQAAVRQLVEGADTLFLNTRTYPKGHPVGGTYLRDLIAHALTVDVSELQPPTRETLGTLLSSPWPNTRELGARVSGLGR